MRFFAILMYSLTLAKADIFLPALFQMSEIWSSKVNFLSNFTPNSFSVSLLPFLNPSTFILTLSLVLTNKWHFSALLSKRLFLNHSNKPFHAYSRNASKRKPYAFSFSVINSWPRQSNAFERSVSKAPKLCLYLQTSSMFPTLPEANVEYCILFENCIVDSKKCYRKK